MEICLFIQWNKSFTVEMNTIDGLNEKTGPDIYWDSLVCWPRWPLSDNYLYFVQLKLIILLSRENFVKFKINSRRQTGHLVKLFYTGNHFKVTSKSKQWNPNDELEYSFRQSQQLNYRSASREVTQNWPLRKRKITEKVLFLFFTANVFTIWLFYGKKRQKYFLYKTNTSPW